MDAVTLELETTCILGILGRERVTPQKLLACFTLELDLEPTARHGDLSHSVNYADVDGMFRLLADHGGFLLLETMALAALRWVLLPAGPGEQRGAIQQATLHLRKPEVMPLALPGVRLTRSATSLAVESRSLQEGVTGWVLAELDEVTALRVEVPQGRTFTPPAGAAVCGGDGVGPCTLLVVQARHHRGLVDPI
jgi:dihydroneopterin aldolase